MEDQAPTKREVIATVAMVGLLFSGKMIGNVVDDAYKIADAMILKGKEKS